MREEAIFEKIKMKNNKYFHNSELKSRKKKKNYRENEEIPKNNWKNHCNSPIIPRKFKNSTDRKLGRG